MISGYFGRQRRIFDCHVYVLTRLTLAIYFTAYSELTKANLFTQCIHL